MSNETKQTSVDKIVSLLNKEGFAPVLTEEEIKSFKEMEKEQMIQFAEAYTTSDAIYCSGEFAIQKGADDFYNETYGGNK